MTPTITRTIRLTRQQAAFRGSEALYRGFVGGRGAGKTWALSYDLIRRAKRGRTYCCASPTATMMRDVTYPTFQGLARDLGVWGSARLSPYPTVRLTTGATVRFRSADDPQKLRGPNLSGFALDEASLMPREAYDIAIACLREGGEQGWLAAAFTPRGFGHWTYEVFGRSTPDTAIVAAPTRSNPFLPPEFQATLERQYGAGLRALQELDGRFVSLEGAEWPPEYFADDLWFEAWPTEGVVCKAMALDPSKGKDASRPRQGREPDDSAWVWGLVDREGRTWLDADLDCTRDASRIVSDGIAIYRGFGPHAVVIEVNLFQELLGPELGRQARALGLGALPLYGITNTEAKEVRVRAVGPHLAQRELRFRRTPGCRRLVQQLRDWPAGAKDDGPDALSMLLRMFLHLVRGRQAGPGQPTLLRA